MRVLINYYSGGRNKLEKKVIMFLIFWYMYIYI